MEDRELKFKEVISKRQLDLTVVLENVHDPHNIGAVIRSCDAVGVSEIYVLYTEKNLTKEHFKIGKSSSTGVSKWIDIHFYTDHNKCFEALSKKYKNLIATAWGEKAVPMYKMDFTASMALIFGNEKDGVSDLTLEKANGFMCIPQVGMAQSLNISVACAVTLYEALRQRIENGNFNKLFDEDNPDHASYYEKFVKAHFQKRMNKMESRKGIKKL